jgi:tryprostatin B 6-hydroxylase
MSDLTKPAAFAAGVASHLLYFHRGEHHMYGLTYFWSTISTSVAAIIYLITQRDYAVGVATSTVLSLVGAWLVGIYSSLLLWRTFLNPLNRFPGPYFARFSQFWWSQHIGGGSKAFLKSQDLHKKYGDFVRVTPHSLSITHPEAPELLYGHKSKCRKAEW